MIAQFRHAFGTGTARAAEYLAAGFQTVADDLDPAMGADGSQGVNGTLEAVENMPLLASNNLKGFVVIVSAGFAAWHWQTPRSVGVVVEELD